MGGKKDKIFEVNKEEVNKYYLELIKANFNCTQELDIIDFDVIRYTDKRLVSNMYLDIKRRCSEVSDNINYNLEVIRVEHIINRSQSGALDKSSFVSSSMGIYMAIFVVFLQSWIDAITQLPSVISNIFNAIMFIYIILLFIQNVKGFNSIDNEKSFRESFSLLFYTLYLDILKTCNSNT